MAAGTKSPLTSYNAGYSTQSMNGYQQNPMPKPHPIMNNSQGMNDSHIAKVYSLKLLGLSNQPVKPS